MPLNMICPHRKQLSTAVRLQHDAVKAQCEVLMTAPTNLID